MCGACQLWFECPHRSSAWGRTGFARSRRAKEFSFLKFDMNNIEETKPVLSPARADRAHRPPSCYPERGQEPASCFWASLCGARKVFVRTEEHDANEAITWAWKAVTL